MIVTEYVCGFFYHLIPDSCQVLLVQKKQPEWQKGLFNGVGGKVKRDEPPFFAMTREFQEETGLVITRSRWRHCVTFFHRSIPGLVYFFSAQTRVQSEQTECPLKNDVGESLVWVDVQTVPAINAIANLQWLVPLCAEEYIQFPLSIMYLDERRSE